MNDSDKSKNQLISENIELKRIEQFLRAEVAELWAHIKKIESLPFYTFWLKMASKLDFRASKGSEKGKKDKPSLEIKIPKSQLDCDFLFVFSTDLQEIGGLKTSGKLAKDLINRESWKINGLALNHNPIIKNEDNFFVYEISEDSKIQNVVACGSDTIDRSITIAKKYQSKFILLMMGLDHLFAPTYSESQKFIYAIKNADLVLCLSPHLAKQAITYGAKRVEIAPLGFDEREFSYSGTTKRKKIMVSCRTSPDKGLKYVLPSLFLLREKGWEIVGFGDLPDHAAADAFDIFLGRITASELNEQFQDTKFLIDPSWIEGLGLVALEAAACGVMPVISARGDYKDLFEANKRPFLEIQNFIDPSLLIQIIEQNENSIDLSELITNAKNINWSTGLDRAVSELKTLVKQDF